jgi:hypothetical protein
MAERNSKLLAIGYQLMVKRINGDFRTLEPNSPTRLVGLFDALISILMDS